MIRGELWNYDSVVSRSTLLRLMLLHRRWTGWRPFINAHLPAHVNSITFVQSNLPSTQLAGVSFLSAALEIWKKETDCNDFTNVTLPETWAEIFVIEMAGKYVCNAD